MKYKKMWTDCPSPSTYSVRVEGESKTRSGLALTAKQMFDKVMSNQGSTALISAGDQYDRDATNPDDFGSDERELATKFQEVQQAKKKSAKKLRETVENVAKNAQEKGFETTFGIDSESDS